MQLFIKLNQTYVVDVVEGTTVSELHQTILEKTGIPKEYYFLTCNGRYIGLGQLKDYKITNQNTIHMTLRCCPVILDKEKNKENNIQVFVKFNKTHTFNINKYDNIDTLRNMIHNRFGYDKKSYYLIANGKLLDSGNLKKFNIDNDSTIWGSFRSQSCEYHNTLEDSQASH